MAAKKQNSDVEKIEPGMVVEATEGDLGEKDVSKPKVADVVEDQNGNIEKVVVTKGVAKRGFLSHSIGCNASKSCHSVVTFRSSSTHVLGKCVERCARSHTRCISDNGWK